MFYELKNISIGDLRLGDEPNAKEYDDIHFNVDCEVDRDFPALLILHTTNVDYQKNRVALNGNFLGCLRVNQQGHIFEIDNHIRGRLKKTGNKVTIVSCDPWGDRKSVSNLNIDDIHIKNIAICYKPK